MFNPSIVESDAFLEMPISTHALYFHLGMNADDDGFVNPKKIMRMIGVTDDDLKVLISKHFVLPFENGVIVIKHWRMNNLVRKDWYRPSQYVECKAKLYIKDNGSYTTDPSQGIPMIQAPKSLVNEPVPNSLTTSLPQIRIDQDRIGEEKKDVVALKYLTNPPKEDMDYFKTRFLVTDKEILDKCEDLLNYCRMHKKYYKSYRAFLLNALKGDFKARGVMKDIKSLGNKFKI